MDTVTLELNTHEADALEEYLKEHLDAFKMFFWSNPAMDEDMRSVARKLEQALRRAR